MLSQRVSPRRLHVETADVISCVHCTLTAVLTTHNQLQPVVFVVMKQSFVVFSWTHSSLTVVCLPTMARLRLLKVHYLCACVRGVCSIVFYPDGFQGQS